MDTADGRQGAATTCRSRTAALGQHTSHAPHVAGRCVRPAPWPESSFTQHPPVHFDTAATQHWDEDTSYAGRRDSSWYVDVVPINWTARCRRYHVRRRDQHRK